MCCAAWSKRAGTWRHEREARDATERQLRDQRERELKARHALAQARRIIAMCVFLTVVAVAAAVFGYVSTQRARRAEQQAQSARAAAETCARRSGTSAGLSHR